MAETVLPCVGDLAGAARNPGVPEMPHEGGVQRARSAALPTLQGPVPDRRRHPGDADRRSKTREINSPAWQGRPGLTPPRLCPRRLLRAAWSGYFVKAHPHTGKRAARAERGNRPGSLSYLRQLTWQGRPGLTRPRLCPRRLLRAAWSGYFVKSHPHTGKGDAPAAKPHACLLYT